MAINAPLGFTRFGRFCKEHARPALAATLVALTGAVWIATAWTLPSDLGAMASALGPWAFVFVGLAVTLWAQWPTIKARLLLGGGSPEQLVLARAELQDLARLVRRRAPRPSGLSTMVRTRTTFLRPGVVGEIMTPIALDGEPAIVCSVIADRIDALATRLTPDDLDPDACLWSEREQEDPVIKAARERLLEIKQGLDRVEVDAAWLANTMKGVRAVVSVERFQDLLVAAGVTRTELADGDAMFFLQSAPQDPLQLTIAGWLSRETGRLTRESLNPILFADLNYRPTSERAPRAAQRRLLRGNTAVDRSSARKAP